MQGGRAGDERLVANVSDGGLDCRRHNNNNRLDTRAIQQWIADAIREEPGRKWPPGPHQALPFFWTATRPGKSELAPGEVGRDRVEDEGNGDAERCPGTGRPRHGAPEAAVDLPLRGGRGHRAHGVVSPSSTSPSAPSSSSCRSRCAAPERKRFPARSAPCSWPWGWRSFRRPEPGSGQFLPRFLKQRRHSFCVVTCAFSCIACTFGSGIISIASLVILMRPGVRQLFDAAGKPPDGEKLAGTLHYRRSGTADSSWEDQLPGQVG